MSPIDEKLQMLASDSNTFSQGIAKMIKFYIDKKTIKETPLYNPISNTDAGNHLLLEDNSYINLGP